LKEIPEEIKRGLEIICVERMDEALKHIFKKKFRKTK
jgi:ATP-dependent Lon protease